MRLGLLTLAVVLCTVTPIGAANAGEECYRLPEVRAYLDTVRVRTQERWQLPPRVPRDSSVTLKFKIETTGTLTDVLVVDAEGLALGQSAFVALSSASPFPAMSEKVRCLAEEPITATFRNPTRPY